MTALEIAVTLGELLDKGIRYDPEVQTWIDKVQI